MWAAYSAGGTFSAGEELIAPPLGSVEVALLRRRPAGPSWLVSVTRPWTCPVRSMSMFVPAATGYWDQDANLVMEANRSGGDPR